MRFLVDRCAGVTLAKWLRDEGHDVDDASEWPQDPGDAAILQKAADDDRILVTIDTDFGLLIFADERPHRGLVRLPDRPAAVRIAIFSDLLARHETDLAARAVITVSAGRVRISRSQGRDERSSRY
jgi:predicted nuclease of predicted toxin-antitoxin system